METTKRMNLDKVAKSYILDAIDGDAYDAVLNTDAERVQFLLNTFRNEYGYMIERVGFCNALREWFMGLPSAIHIDFENYKILQIAVEWGSLPEKYTERQADKILENWFNLMAVKTCQLFKKYKAV